MDTEDKTRDEPIEEVQARAEQDSQKMSPQKPIECVNLESTARHQIEPDVSSVDGLNRFDKGDKASIAQMRLKAIEEAKGRWSK